MENVFPTEWSKSVENSTLREGLKKSLKFSKLKVGLEMVILQRKSKIS